MELGETILHRAPYCAWSGRRASSIPFLVRKRHDNEDTRGARGVRWMDAEAAAEILGLSVVTLRRTLERNARAEADGATIARVDGITGRKLGRLWRVQLDSRWMGVSIEQG